MSKNRLLYALVAIALVTVATLTGWQAFGSKTVGNHSLHTPQASNHQPAAQGANCLSGECSYQLPNGAWVR